jgi:polyisoprenoid-binding protein YceI
MTAKIGGPDPGVYTIDPAHTTVGFVARYLMLTKVRGRFDRFAGEIHVEPTPEDSWVEVTIEAGSIDTNHPDRDAHLRSPDFLDVERFPTLSFRSTKVERTGDTALRVEGNLTIRDVTRPVVLDAEFLGMTPDPWGNSRAVFSGSTEIDRTEFGASWNVALETGGVLVGRQVQIELEVQALKAKPSAETEPSPDSSAEAEAVGETAA